MIVIEGLIGVGKSTLCELLGKLISRSKVYYEPLDHPYLSLFYKDMMRYGFEMQTFLMARRFRQHEEAIRIEWNQGIQTIHDRSIWGDRAFADMLHKDGLMTDLAYDTYMAHRECMLGFLLIPQIVVWLEASPETCVKRIKARDRVCEAGVSVKYLDALRDAYSKVIGELAAKGSQILTYPWEAYMPAEQIARDILARIPHISPVYEQSAIGAVL